MLYGMIDLHTENFSSISLAACTIEDMTVLNLLPPRDGEGLVIFGHFQKRISRNIKTIKS